MTFLVAEIRGNLQQKLWFTPTSKGLRTLKRSYTVLTYANNLKGRVLDAPSVRTLEPLVQDKTTYLM